ncbi:ATP-binding protein [Streptomyces sp. TRM 70361]|uniref:ATP-binding protein n=1 Tax=Streptomyces sp. TRM 70361 TaxID=3116553 RepID=UPI002E7BB3D0|nr:ATP-binding protein [Streptomyces sp. TRM 70361]MEE1942566.1 ATP-binding protein [Streptomyces sp. TRM 70361]
MGTEGPTVLDRLWHDFPPFDPDTLSGSASCVLPPRHEAVRTAREFTRSTLTRWRLAGCLDNVTLVVSELVTNALRHGLSDTGSGPGSGPGRPAPPIRLHLMHWSGRLVCAVRDPGGKAPVARTPGLAELAGLLGPDPADDTADLLGVPGTPGTEHADRVDAEAESGRGLFLVESFSDGWGWQPMAESVPGASGKVVWALFRLNPRAR